MNDETTNEAVDDQQTVEDITTTEESSTIEKTDGQDENHSENLMDGLVGEMLGAAEVGDGFVPKSPTLNSTEAMGTFTPAAIPEIPKRGRGRPKGSGKKTESAPQAEKPVVDIRRAKAKIEAETLVHINDSILTVLAGEPMDDAPGLRKEYVAAVTEYLYETGEALPPWVTIAAIATVYNLRVLHKPTAKARLAGLWVRARDVFGKFFKRR